VLIGSGEFYVSVAPVHRSGYPSGYAVGKGEEPRADAIPPSIQGHSYLGSPGHWRAFAGAEFSYSVLLSDQ
jgi:hypothetical protein